MFFSLHIFLYFGTTVISIRYDDATVYRLTISSRVAARSSHSRIYCSTSIFTDIKFNIRNRLNNTSYVISARYFIFCILYVTNEKKQQQFALYIMLKQASIFLLFKTVFYIFSYVNSTYYKDYLVSHDGVSKTVVLRNHN